MLDSFIPTHHIQKHIVLTLMFQEMARFRDLRPPKTDTNLFTYHLKAVMKGGLVEKTADGYTLTPHGLSYVDRLSVTNRTVRMQPKLITMLLVQNSNGDVLLQKRTKQPYINLWTLPYGKVHHDDKNVIEAAQREAEEKLHLKNQSLVHGGIASIRVVSGETFISSTLAYVCHFTSDEIVENDELQWVRPHKIHDYRLAPAVAEIIARGFFYDPFFFEEYTINLESTTYPAVDTTSTHTKD